VGPADLKGKVVLLTGASGGIGGAIARAMAMEKAILILAGRNRENLTRIAEAVTAAGGRAVLAAGDVCNDIDREAMIAIAEAEGPIEVLINNAGVEIPVAILDQTSAEIHQQLRVNMLAPILLTRQVLPKMLNRSRGIVVMVSSMAGKSPTPYDSVYSATKFGLNGFTASLRFELSGSGVHLGTVCPGFVSDAGMWAATGMKAPALFPEVSMAKVVAGVWKVLAGKEEVIVAPGPVRPMLALAELFPSAQAPVMRLLGVEDTMKKRAKIVQGKRRAWKGPKL
jgi:short-subunit dehydrogenase